MPRQPRPCVDCGTVFTPEPERAKNTSRCVNCRCRFCLRCNKAFPVSTQAPKQRYCSTACGANSATRRAIDEARIKAAIPCIGCGKRFKVKGTVQRYCSRACAGRHRSWNWPENRTKTCRVCKREFTLGPRQGPNSKRCQECLRPWHSCPTCGKRFQVDITNVRPCAQHYCSVACVNRDPAKKAAQREWGRRSRKQPHRCLVCGAAFPRRHRKQKYCSRACFLRSPSFEKSKAMLRARKGKRREHRDPTPEQIAERAAKIRAGWSEREEEKRRRVDWRALSAVVQTGHALIALPIEDD